MLNNVALDVAIGLVFIYLLYSLLATTIKELLATMFAYRGKMLERGIEQMLDGVNYKYRWWNKVERFFAKKNKQGVKPNRVLTLKNKLFASQVVSHDLYKRLAEKCNTDQPSYLAADTFSDIFIDILKSGKNGPILMKDIAAYVNTLNNRPGLQKILRLYIEQANGDLQKFKLLLENWYNDMMDRVSGWYKQQAYRILIYIGLVLAIVFNISTIEIVEKLSTDKNAREAMVKSATKYVDENINAIQPAANKTTGELPAVPKPDSAATVAEKKADSLKKKDSIAGSKKRENETNTVAVKSNATMDSGFAAIRMKIDSIKLLYKSAIEDNSDVIGLGWGDYGYKEDSLKWVNNKEKKASKPAPKTWYEKVGYILCKTATTPRKWIGFLITALAISLGAPFWFDLLNKFINLRVSGAKPTDANSTPVSKTALLNQKPDPSAKG